MKVLLDVFQVGADSDRVDDDQDHQQQGDGIELLSNCIFDHAKLKPAGEMCVIHTTSM